MSKWVTKLICGYVHYHRLCVHCEQMVWTQDRLPTYACNTCIAPKYGTTLGRCDSPVREDYDGSRDNGVRVLEG